MIQFPKYSDFDKSERYIYVVDKKEVALLNIIYPPGSGGNFLTRLYIVNCIYLDEDSTTNADDNNEYHRQNIAGVVDRLHTENIPEDMIPELLKEKILYINIDFEDEDTVRHIILLQNIKHENYKFARQALTMPFEYLKKWEEYSSMRLQYAFRELASDIMKDYQYFVLDYKKFFIEADPVHVADVFNFFRGTQSADIDSICNQIKKYHQANMRLIEEFDISGKPYNVQV